MNFLKESIDLPYFELDLRSVKKENVFPGKKIHIKKYLKFFLEKEMAVT